MLGIFKQQVDPSSKIELLVGLADTEKFRCMMDLVRLILGILGLAEEINPATVRYIKHFSNSKFGDCSVNLEIDTDREKQFKDDRTEKFENFLEASFNPKVKSSSPKEYLERAHSMRPRWSR